MGAKIHNFLKNGRWVKLEGKRPIEEAWSLSPEQYERVEGGAWKNKKTGELYRVKGEIYHRELKNYRYDDPELIKHLQGGGNIGGV